jgi:hypothetical protein
MIFRSFRETLSKDDHSDHTVAMTPAGAVRAEAIVEAPCCLASGGFLPLADFGRVNFSNVKANGSASGGFGPTKIVMVDGGGRAKDSVSSLAGGGNFSATWLRAT